MLLIRRFEEKAAELYTLGKIGGFCHLYIGQEAVAVGAISTLEPDDYILTSYREHGHALVTGNGPGRGDGGVVRKAERRLEGQRRLDAPFRQAARLPGRAMPLWAARSRWPLGAAFASKYLKQSRVTLGFFGEAAVNIGSFHESLNLAALWKLPVVFICENNRFGMGTPIERASSLYDLSQKACAYNMARTWVDGMDVLAVREALKEAVERARKESAPTLIEARTYRFMGHSMSDPAHGHYRTKSEVEAQRRHDPIKNLTAALETVGVINAEFLEELDQKIRDIVEEAVAFAERSPEPEPQEFIRTFTWGKRQESEVRSQSQSSSHQLSVLALGKRLSRELAGS